MLDNLIDVLKIEGAIVEVVNATPTVTTLRVNLYGREFMLAGYYVDSHAPQTNNARNVPHSVCAADNFYNS